MHFKTWWAMSARCHLGVSEACRDPGPALPKHIDAHSHPEIELDRIIHLVIAVTRSGDLRRFFQ